MKNLGIVLEYLPSTIREKIELALNEELAPNAQKMQNGTGTECTKNAKWNRH